MKEAKISVIIPVRNEAKRIERCLEAVFSQSLKPHEVIVVDGRSTDKTVEKASQFPVKGMPSCIKVRRSTEAANAG